MFARLRRIVEDGERRRGAAHSQEFWGKFVLRVTLEPEGIPLGLIQGSATATFYFRVASPGTAVVSLSSQGLTGATQTETIVVGVALPLYYYRNQIIRWFQGKSVQPDDRGD